MSSAADFASRLCSTAGLSNTTSRVAAGLVVVFVLGTACSIETTGELLTALEAWVVGSFGGLLVKVGKMGFAAKMVSYLMIVRYSFEGLVKSGRHQGRLQRLA